MNGLWILSGFENSDGFGFKDSLNLKHAEGILEAAPQFALQLVVLIKLGLSLKDWRGELIE